MISVKNLKKFYDNIHNIYILNNLNLIVEDGEFLGIMGASGSGKSTLLRILGGMESFSDGEVKIEGQNLLSMKTGRSRNELIGILLEYAIGHCVIEK